MQRRANCNRQRRGAPRRSPFRARPIALGASTATSPDLKVEKRVFTRDITLNLTQTSGNEAFQTYALDDFLYRYDGTEPLVDAYDQYRYDRIEVFIKNNAANALSSTNPQAALLSLASTTCTSVIDLDSGSSLASSEFTTYTNAKELAVGPRWRRVASYRPAVKCEDVGTIGVVRFCPWLSTASTTVSQVGYQGLIMNPCGAQYFGTAASTCQKVEIRIRAHLSFRGRRSLITSSISALFFQNFSGSVLTVHAPGGPTTRTIDSWSVSPTTPFTFRWVGSGTDNPISSLIDILKAEMTPAGHKITWSGPTVPRWLLHA